MRRRAARRDVPPCREEAMRVLIYLIKLRRDLQVNFPRFTVETLGMFFSG